MVQFAGAELEVAATPGYDPCVLGLPDGRFVVIWGDNSAAILGRFFSADGAAGDDFTVSTPTEQQSDPRIAALSDGRFMVTWWSWDGEATGTNIRARIFNADGTAIGSEFIVNTQTAYSQTYPSITALSDRQYVVTWHSFRDDDETGDRTDFEICVRLFNADGTSVGSQFTVSIEGTLHNYPDVTALSDGQFAVTWVAFDGASNIRTRIFDADGTPVSEDIVIYGPSTIEGWPRIATLADDRIVVTWISYENSGAEASVAGHIFNSDGASIGSEFVINSATLIGVDVAAMSDGRFIVTWTTDEAQTGIDIRARIFNADGTSASGDFTVNRLTEGDQYEPTIASLTDGNAVAVWTSQLDDGRHLIHAQVLELPNGVPIISIAEGRKIEGGPDEVPRIEFIVSLDHAVDYDVTFQLAGIPQMVSELT